ncbi:MAG: hypothetical protein HZA90_20590 [Verrucomicrobia bacterium]|nr:hypothetical protein [Verrucomicrobiota bacterium]
MLQTGRPKDRLRAAQSRDDLELDGALLDQILARHNLVPAWPRLQTLSDE